MLRCFCVLLAAGEEENRRLASKVSLVAIRWSGFYAFQVILHPPPQMAKFGFALTKSFCPSSSKKEGDGCCASSGWHQERENDTQANWRFHLTQPQAQSAAISIAMKAICMLSMWVLR